MRKVINLLPARQATRRRAYFFQIRRPTRNDGDVIGLHLDGEHLYAAHVRHEPNGVSTTCAYTEMVSLRPGAIVKGNICEQSEVADMLARILMYIPRPVHARVVMGVAGAHTNVACITISPEKRHESLARVFARASEELVPFAGPNAFMDSQPLAPIMNSFPRYLLGIAHRYLVETMVGVATRAGFPIDAIEPCTVALLRTASQELEPDEVRGCAFVHIGDDLTHVAISSAQGELVSHRDLPVGTRTIRKAIEKERRVNERDAKALLHYVLKDELDLPDIVSAATIVRNALPELLAQIENWIEQLRIQEPILGLTRIERAFCSGELTGLEGFMDIANAIFSLPCRRLFVPRAQNTFAIAYGLALHRFRP